MSTPFRGAVSAVSYLIIGASLAITPLGCATQHTTHQATATQDADKASRAESGGAVATDAKQDRSSAGWVYPHGTHMHPFPWHKGQKPAFPVEGD